MTPSDCGNKDHVGFYSKRTAREVTEFHKRTHANKTGFLGVKALKDGRFAAYIIEHGKKEKTYCGSAKTAEAAARMYDLRALDLYGAEAVTNFPASDYQ